MKSSIREQKSLYLAFALTISIEFNTLKDEYQTTDNQFSLNLCKDQQILSKTKDFGIDQIIKQTEMYLYIKMTNFDNLSQQEYTIKMTEQSQNGVNVIFEEMINLNHYVQDHKIHNKNFWTEITPTVHCQRFSLTIKKRVFMKKNKFQLDDLINSEETGEEHDTVLGLDHSPTILRNSKLGIDKRKSKSFQLSIGNFTPIPPRRLDTISEEDSNIPMTQKRDNQEFMYGFDSHEKYKIRQRFSEGLKQNTQGFESALKRQSTWIEKNRDTDAFDELVSAFQNPNILQHVSQFKKKQSNKMESKKSLQSQFSKINSKGSKLTKASQQQDDQNEVSFLDKSSLLMDLQKSQLNITPDQEICFKLKWILLIFIVLALAIFSSLSTEAFSLTQSHKEKHKKSKKDENSHKQIHKKNEKQKNHSKAKSNKNKQKKNYA